MPSYFSTVDRVVNFFNPEAGLRRARARVRIGAISDAGYLTPDGPQKSMKGLRDVRANAPSWDIDKKLELSRALNRDLSMNTSLATAIFRRYRTNVVGAGLQVQPRIDWKFLGLSAEEAAEWTETAIREFDLWSEALEAEYAGSMNFYEMQGLSLLSYLINGDMFFALPWIKSKRAGWPYETTVKLIDADLVRTPDDSIEGGYVSINQSTMSRIRNGVEYDKAGRLDAYHVASFYKRDNWPRAADGKKESFQRIPVFDAEGERQIFHLMDNERIQQRRGIPMLAPVVEDLKNLTRLSKSELMSALVASMFTVFVRDKSGMGGALQQGFTPPESQTGGGAYGPDAEPEDKNTGDEWDLEMGYGNIINLDDDKDVTLAETRDKGDFDPFFTSMAKQVSAAAEVPLDIVLLHFNKSFSALQGAKLEAGKRWRSSRALLRRRLNQPVYEMVMREAILKGRIKAPRFFDDPIYRAAWCRSTWVGGGEGYLDPLKEARAATIKINGELSTREEEYAAATGGRWLPMVERLAREKEVLEEAGLETELESEEELPTITNTEEGEDGEGEAGGDKPEGEE